MSSTSHNDDGLLEELLEAMGGATRIRGIVSYAREAALTWAPAARAVPDVPGAGGLDSLSLVLREMARLDARAGRETIFRAAPGRACIEITTLDSSRTLGRAGGWGAAVLREAAFEPRNLLAHAPERGAMARAMPDGGIEIAVPDRELLYRFDPATRLCAGRTQVRGSASTLYRDWRYVDGIATPFLEIELDALGRLERQILAVAYDIPLPGRLFA